MGASGDLADSANHSIQPSPRRARPTLAIGLLGEYLGRIYDEVKERPPYIVKCRFSGHLPEGPAQPADGSRPSEE
jgi:hypothetical protein